MWALLQHFNEAAGMVEFSAPIPSDSSFSPPALARGFQSLSFNSCISKSWSMSLAPAICLEVGLNLVQLLTSDLLSTLLSTPSLAFAVDCDVV
jgi:hypothetical protein